MARPYKLGDQPDKLLPLVRAGDPEATTAIELLAVDHLALDDIHAALADPATGSETRDRLIRAVVAESNVHPFVENFINGGSELDGVITANIDAVTAGQSFFADHGVAIITVLFHQALPEAYLGRRGVQALYMTGELSGSWSKRIIDTGQFLINTLSPDPAITDVGRSRLHAGGKGAVAIRQLRLIHAVNRMWVLAQKVPQNANPIRTLRAAGRSRWQQRMTELNPPEDLQVLPINQEDLLATLTTFTTMTLDGLAKLGIQASDAEADGFHLLWNIIGWHLGIGDRAALAAAGYGQQNNSPTPFPNNELLPFTRTEMDAQTEFARHRLQGETVEGQHLAKVLMERLTVFLFEPARGVSGILTRYLIGDERADLLGIDEGGLTSLATRTLPVFDGISHAITKSPFASAVTRLSVGLVTRYAMRAFIEQTRGNGGLEIDDEIAARWGVGPGPTPTSTPT